MEAVMKKFVALAGLLVLGGLIGVAFAGQSEEPLPSTASPARTSNPYPYTNPISRKGSSPAEIAGDGRYFGYVRAADAEAQPQTISFDVAQFFFGNDVQKAAEEDGAVAPGEAVANDHYQRNPKRDVRLLRVAPDVQVTGGPPASFLLTQVSRETLKKCSVQPPGACVLSSSEFFAAAKQLKEYAAGYPGIPVWVTIADGRVVRIDEQYFP
jgi:hypothetical protein